MKTVVITDLRTCEAQEIAAFLREKGYKTVTPPSSVPLWQEAALKAYSDSLPGPILGVIHPAPPLFHSSLEDTDEDTFARARDEGPLAAWCVTKVFGTRMRLDGGGALIYVNSIHAEKPMGLGFLFSAGCGAVQMLSREVSQDLGTHGVHSYFIQRGPSTTDPDMRSSLSALYCGLDHRYPARQVPGPDSLNGLVRFLLTPEAAVLSGSDLRADGGMTMYYGQRLSEEEAQEMHLRVLETGKVVVGEDRD